MFTSEATTALPTWDFDAQAEKYRLPSYRGCAFINAKHELPSRIDDSQLHRFSIRNAGIGLE